MQMARTTCETIHGNPGERRILPVNTLIAIEPASNLPADNPIKWWAHRVKGHPWPKETEEWAEDVGVGLHAEDVALVKMQPTAELNERWRKQDIPMRRL